MPKNVGLSQQHKKYLRVMPLPNDKISYAVALYLQAKSYYYVFKLAFGNGSKIIQASNPETNTNTEHLIPNIDNLFAVLVNYHFSIEMMLKSLICLKTGSLEERLKIHDLITLLQNARPHYLGLSKIGNNSDYKQLLQELSSSFNVIHYGEGTIVLSHKKRSGWKKKLPLQELSEMLDCIFIILVEILKKQKKP